MSPGMPPMGGQPPQMPPQMPPGGAGGPLGQLGQKPSTPTSGAPLLQMIMTLLAGAGLKDFSSSITGLLKGLGGGPSHKKGSGMPPGEQPSKGAGPMPPPNVAGPAGPGGPPAGPGSLDPQMLQKLLAMLSGGGQQSQQ